MAKRRAARGGAGRGTGSKRGASGSGGSGHTLAAFAVLAAALAGGAYLYRHTGATYGAQPQTSPSQPLSSSPRPSTQPPSASPQPTATAAAPLPSTHPPPSAATGPVPIAPFGTSEEVFEHGARLYAANCVGCHGRPGKDARGPLAAQFWNRSNVSGAQAVAQSAGTLFQQTAKGNLVQGMPSYGQRLTDTELWDIALLLKSAHEELPEPVLRLLRTNQ